MFAWTIYLTSLILLTRPTRTKSFETALGRSILKGQGKLATLSGGMQKSSPDSMSFKRTIYERRRDDDSSKSNYHKRRISAVARRSPRAYRQRTHRRRCLPPAHERSTHLGDSDVSGDAERSGAEIGRGESDFATESGGRSRGVPMNSTRPHFSLPSPV